ncbi:type II toxin-antitoxin system VapC family toxin [Salinarimonas sp. NSM]|uniref:type II toxin-antitoxin system VapC family toxin n=1 Tax=Salinarimonas sp. NSM TaxID=3458003 RepID=UPI0040361D1B
MSGDVVRVYVDTNAFVVAFETTGDDSDAMKLLLNAALQGRISLFTSDLTLAEVLVVPERTGNVTLTRAYKQALIWSRAIELVAVTREILIETAQYRARAGQATVDNADRRNFLPDSIHAVTAIRSGCSAFLASDRRIRLPSGMTRVPPLAPAIKELLKQA